MKNGITIIYGSFLISIIVGIVFFAVGLGIIGFFFLAIGIFGLFTMFKGSIQETSVANKLDEVLRAPIEAGKDCQYPSVWDMWMVYSRNEEGSQLVSKLLHDGMKNNLLYGADNFFRDDPDAKKRYDSIAYELIKSKMAKPVTDETMQKVDDLAGENKIANYFLVDVSRSSRPDINAGTYIGSFDESDNLTLLRAPFTSYSLPNNQAAAIFDRRLYLPIVKIPKTSIKDFQTFGSQLMQSTVASETSQEKIGILSTGLSEIVFGTAYTMLKGMSKISVNTKHEIKDVRIVQVVFNDKTDVEFKGITIFFEFNRRMGNIKNKESDEKTAVAQKIEPNTPVKTPSNSSYIQELKDLKELLDSGIITEQEFVEKKKDILAKK